MIHSYNNTIPENNMSIMPFWNNRYAKSNFDLGDLEQQNDDCREQRVCDPVHEQSLHSGRKGTPA